MRADQGRPDILELFHEDAEIYFPKFGFGSGRNSFLEMFKGFEGTLEYIQHDYDRLIFVPSADHLVVEGTSQGRMSGKSWAGGKTPGGRFCNVFKFRDGRISSLHIYLDPDYTGEDEARFRWVRTVSGESDGRQARRDPEDNEHLGSLEHPWQSFSLSGSF
jgi:ketosteroid isomerase-like protein